MNSGPEIYYKFLLQKSKMFGIDSIKSQGSLLLNSMPDLIKRVSTAAIFKRSIRNWSGGECNCKYVDNEY